MNLKTMVDKIAFALNYNPEIQVYEDEIVQVLNDRYLEISSREDWLFLHGKSPLYIRAPITAGSNQITTVTDNYQITFTAGTFTGISASILEGQTLVVGSSEFTIVRRVDSGNLAVEGDASAITTPNTNWSIQFRRYPYPDRAEEILDIISRSDDRGKLHYVDWRTEVKSFLDRDDTGDPVAYIEDEHEELLPPENPPSLVASGSGGSLTNGNVYQYCYTFLWKGIESPPSPVAEYTATATGQITVASLEDTSDENGYSTYKRKKIYRRDVTGGGRWKFVSTVQSGVLTDDDDGTNVANDESEFLFNYGPRPYFRCWYTADTDLEFEVRYKKLPRRMQSDSDVPMWPVAYHDIIVHSALEDLCLAHGMPAQSQVYRGKAERKIKQMSSKYLTRKDARYQRKGFGKTLMRTLWGDPVKV